MASYKAYIGILLGRLKKIMRNVRLVGFLTWLIWEAGICKSVAEAEAEVSVGHGAVLLGV